MKDTRYILIYLACICCLLLGSSEAQDHEQTENENTVDYDDPNMSVEKPDADCWMSLDAAKLFKTLDEIDGRYSFIRNATQKTISALDYDVRMLNRFIRLRGMAVRERYKVRYREQMIPSGINLGGTCMLRMTDSILFFHRMKLRNNTYFNINGLHNDLANLVVQISMALNDLHLKGAYERSLTSEDPSILYYAPTAGQVEFLLKNVHYRLEGRYRLTNNRLTIELISSEIFVNDVMMTYINQAIESAPIKIEKENLGSYMGRLKTDLDKWVKDYLNDYTVHENLEHLPYIEQMSNYSKEIESAHAGYMDHALRIIRERLQNLSADSIQQPEFTFKCPQGLDVKLYDGVLRGLDSIYRRSIATGLKQEGDVRKVDTIVGFSSLKVVFKYEAVVPTGIPPLTGTMTLSANDLTAHLALTLVQDPETVDLDIEFLDQTKPESLTVEGAANLMVANFKHLMEHQIIAVMSNTLIYGIRTLKSLPSCVPFIPGQLVKKKGQKKYAYSYPLITDDGKGLRSR